MLSGHRALPSVALPSWTCWLPGLCALPRAPALWNPSRGFSQKLPPSRLLAPFRCLSGDNTVTLQFIVMHTFCSMGNYHPPTTATAPAAPTPCVMARHMSEGPGFNSRAFVFTGYPPRSASKCLLSSCCVLGTVPDVGDML